MGVLELSGARGTQDLQRGRPAPPHADLFRRLFADLTAQHAYELLRQRNPLARALSGDATIDTWRAWMDAREALARGRPWDAMQRLERLAVLHGRAGGGLAGVEVSSVVAECLARGHQPEAAIDAAERLHDDLFAFAERAGRDAEPIADELRLALAELTGAEGLTVSSEDIVGSWALGRGLELLLDAAVLETDVLAEAHSHGAAREIAERVDDDLGRFHAIFGVAFGTAELGTVELARGNAWTEVDVERALGHFEAAVGWSGENLSASVNAANCLLRLGRFAEAEARYSALEPAFEHRGDNLGAARVWAAECIAAWKDRRDPGIRQSLVGAIKFFEDNLPDTADPVTLHTLKRFNEPALTLLVAVIAASTDRSDERVEELLSALWALQRSELRAELEREAPTDDTWGALHARQSRRLEITKAMLEPFPATRVVHVCSATDELVFVAYGYDADDLRVETSLLAEGGERTLGRFLELMSEQLAADLRRDEAQLAQIDEELAACGDALGSALAPGFVELLRSADHVYYMPHPYGALDMFPLGGLRFGGEWLATSTTITRTPTPNHLRENLASTRPVPAANAVARVVTGDPDAGPAALRLLQAEANRAVHILGVLGFDSAAVEDASAQDLVGLLDGGAGALHYLGHGVASDVYEGLPLHSGDVLRPVHLDALPGFTTGFVFICACEAGGVRHGAGGYQTGVASRIVERGAPGVLAFTHPIVEERASSVVREFYPRARELPFGQAVRETQRRLAPAVPAYAWLALAAFGDPQLTLTGLAGKGEIGTSSGGARTWHSALRSFAALRTDAAREAALEAVSTAPDSLAALARELLESAFREPPTPGPAWLEALDEAALGAADASPPGRLSLHAAVVLERAHAVGLDAFPIRFPEPEDASALFRELVLVAQIGATLFDTRLNGLAHALVGRLLAWSDGDLTHAGVPLSQASEKLLEAVPHSPFLARIRVESDGIVRQFGGA